MADESSPPLPRPEESIESETDTALEPELELVEPAPDASGEHGFVCDCGEWMRSACKGLPFFRAHENQRLCVLHYPGKEKSADFKTALDSKLNKKQFDFRGVWFPDEVNFSNFEFGAAVDFSSATFNAVADFSYTTFSADALLSDATFSAGAYFNFARFNAAAYFTYATFSAAAYFTYATFSAAAHFSYATFGAAAYFNYATLSAVEFNLSVFHARADFSGASFNDSIHFFGSASEVLLKDGASLAAKRFGKDPSLDFQHVKIEHPGRVSFHTLKLRPHWFVNVDSRQFIFTDVEWDWDRSSINQEITALGTHGVSSPRMLLAIACRQLAENAEANNRYEEASRFRYWAMDLARRTKWSGWRFWKTDWLHMLYWAVSGYGERILRALGVLAAVWLVFALLYTRVGFVPLPPKLSDEGESMRAMIMSIQEGTGQPLEFSRALTYSLAVMSLQKPDPKPFTGTAQTLVLLETILGPVQAALLALAIRRKFMR